MLTRLQIHGFKNLLDVDIAFGPFTCIAGANGVGKSNHFDAIRFLSALAERPLNEAAASVRSESFGSSDTSSLFNRTGDSVMEEMELAAEMVIPRRGVDDLGQEAEATMTYLRYGLTLARTESGLEVRSESLRHLNKSDSRSNLGFPHKKAWRDSAVTGRRTSPFISTVSEAGQILIKLHNDGPRGYLGGGRPRPHIASRLPRSVLSSATNAAESPTVTLARREMQAWRLLQLEPSALRAPDSYNAPHFMAPNGAHLPATLARLTRWNRSRPPSDDLAADFEITREATYAEISNRLAELIEDVYSIRIDADDSRELLKLMLKDLSGTEYEAKSLSDGTLRFLALAILESDPLAGGVFCLEEPENGIHPERIPAMLRLLKDLATDPTAEVDELNPLRQVIVNTHSPAVVAQIEASDLLFVLQQKTLQRGTMTTKPAFLWLDETWRSHSRPEVPCAPAGRIRRYLTPIKSAGKDQKTRGSVRVVDRQEMLPFLVEADVA
ncbi:MAG: AAA family ATPase [Acidobacteriota bacterium]